MTIRNESDVVRRALIALLSPRSFLPESAASTAIREKRFRRSGRAAGGTFEPVVAKPAPAHVSIVEQLTPQTLSVCWSDAQSGHYADQVWRRCIARRPSVCVLTGMHIRPGDFVFRPRAGRARAPANRDYMILAASVPENRSDGFVSAP